MMSSFLHGACFVVKPFQLWRKYWATVLVPLFLLPQQNKPKWHKKDCANSPSFSLSHSLYLSATNNQCSVYISALLPWGIVFLFYFFYRSRISVCSSNLLRYLCTRCLCFLWWLCHNSLFNLKRLYLFFCFLNVYCHDPWYNTHNTIKITLKFTSFLI